MAGTSHPVTKAIVTGHTRGIGAALVDALRARGIDVLGIARSRRVPAAADASNQAALPGRFDEVELDLSDSGKLAQWLAGHTLAAFLSGAERALLVNNAGTLGPVGPSAVQPPADIASAVALNVAAPLMLAGAFSAVTANVPDRRIAHVSSGAARNPYPGWNIYCATKAALDHHARAAALDAERGLRVASVAPGVVDTEMQGQIRGIDEARFPLRERFAEMKRSGQLTSPEEAAGKFADYLLSDTFGQTPTADIRSL
ncbi:SDR family oxidoreductase [Trinickia dinghuensis]|uniref:Short chain dehydrogenase n=1 Tax=Trinickia dinghuensis TaxID=2291023 RepID=A0A3D8JW31_9BURK|nr:SDR family oxidoreductase [Trinickia dinghuensis]RDU96814.1 short chain dehydrogenase [Trinickia dinghuensis]